MERCKEELDTRSDLGVPEEEKATMDGIKIEADGQLDSRLDRQFSMSYGRVE